MPKSVKPEDVSDYIISLLDKYKLDVQDVVKTATQKRAKEIKPELQSYSQRGERIRIGGYMMNTGRLFRTGSYRSGWAYKTVNKKDGFQIKVYNKKNPSLVHLLEFGHKGPIHAKAYPHVRKTELKYLGLLKDDLERGIEKI